jgi:glycosyltransferase involved in cell wall biosynthesis
VDSLENKYGKKIIIFFPRIPYPLREHGISVRYLPIIEHLSKSHTLDLVIFRRRPDRKESYEELRKYCRNVSYVQNPKYLDHGTCSKLMTYCRFSAPWTPPLAPVAHGAGDVQRVITEHAGKDRYDVLLWVGAMFLPHLQSAMPLKNVGRYLVDFIDSPSLIKERWQKETFRFDFLERYELWKTIRWEGEVIRKMDETLYISDVDSRTVPDALTPGKRRHVIPNGVDFGSYTAGKVDGIVSPSIGFLGNMGYRPNIEAVHWLYEKVYLPIRSEMPGLSMIVIGKDPVDSVKKLGSEPGVVVTGTVETIWPYINSVDVFVFPLLRGAGLKNKILETMGAGRPVITTAIGNEGIDAVDGRDISIRNTPEEFRMEAVRLLRSADARRAIGDSARRFVRERFSWERILTEYEEIVIGTGIRKLTDAVPRCAAQSAS